MDAMATTKINMLGLPYGIGSLPGSTCTVGSSRRRSVNIFQSDARTVCQRATHDECIVLIGCIYFLLIVAIGRCSCSCGGGRGAAVAGGVLIIWCG